jgi:hypothetical protein
VSREFACCAVDDGFMLSDPPETDGTCRMEVSHCKVLGE